MCDLEEIIGSMKNITLIIKTRSPGNNANEIRKLLKDENDEVIILDHAKVGPIEEYLQQIDIIVGCATNAVINTLLRGVPSIVYINAHDQLKIEKRSMERLPYERFGIPVVTEKKDLQQLIQKLSDECYRDDFLHKQQQAMLMYPNFDGKPATQVICSIIRSKFN